ncbi:DUF6705 family protein [Flavobacterium terrigena]|uniref:DUF6705 domain-containing protein n=1 Tax=Flavobacterium terrigena TaxID=402734 RepID=A0A1H6X863_9FLAO|nr:DUF6705 family protein [Flavobacterium terrigena]SEJ21120.1 hypothetical protein SAMN05660918_2665 [Flavobacterium terrigena]
MENIIKIIILTISLNCYSQSPIIDIIDKDGTRTTNAYYKDVNNLLNTFEGTWLYTNGATSLKIVMIKKMQQFNGRYYEDLIIGEYEYKVNDVIVISTLSELNNNYSNQSSHSIAGSSIMNNNNRPICTNCTVNEKRLRTGFEDPVRDSYGTMIVKKTTQNGLEAIQIKTRLSGYGTPWIEGQPQPPTDFTVPAGEYILIKQ